MAVVLQSALRYAEVVKRYPAVILFIICLDLYLLYLLGCSEESQETTSLLVLRYKEVKETLHHYWFTGTVPMSCCAH